jgi:peptidoglycan-associated lipoprotein
MHSRLLTAIFILGLAAVVAACGSKNKKPAETPASTDTEVPVDKASAPVDDSGAVDDAPPPPPAPPTLGELIYFEFDSTLLNDEARDVLNGNAAWMSEDAKRRLRIEGHTDEVGTTEYNLGLGDRRARAARDYLVRLGIDDGRVSIITFGEERPTANEDAGNRRSVFVATKK